MALPEGALARDGSRTVILRKQPRRSSAARRGSTQRNMLPLRFFSVRVFASMSLGVLALANGPSARAEPSEEQLQIARQRFQEGVVAADTGDYEAARIA